MRDIDEEAQLDYCEGSAAGCLGFFSTPTKYCEVCDPHRRSDMRHETTEVERQRQGDREIARENGNADTRE